MLLSGKHKFLVAVLAGILACAPLSFAQTTTLHLSVDDAVKHALDGNITVKKGALALRSSERDKKYSWNSLSPSINANAGISKEFPARGLLKSDADFSSDPTVTIGASATIRFSPSLITTVKGAALNYEKQLIDYDTAKRTIELNVRKAFYAILYEQENIELQKKNVESAKSQYSSNLTRYNRGLLPRLDVLNSQLAYQNAKLSLDNAELTLVNDKASFKLLLGVDLDSDIVLSGNLEDVLSLGDISIDSLEQHSSTIASIQKQIEIARNGLLATRLGAYAPSLTGGYSYNLSRTLSDSSDWLQNGTLSLGVSIPLDGYLPWSSGAQSIANQKDNLETLELELENERRSLKITTQQNVNKIKLLQSTVEVRRQSIDYSQQAWRMTRDAYNNGTKDLLALQTASDNLLSAQVNLKSSAYNLATAILDLEDTIGVPFGTLLQKKGE